MEIGILIADDVSTNRELIKLVLKRILPSCPLIEAENGKVALEKLKSEKIGVVILDIMMPELDGIEVLKRIKDDPLLGETQVLMWSALDEFEILEEALKLGALDYFTKPLTEEQVKITLPLKVKNALKFYEQKCKLIEYYRQTKEEMQLAEVIQKALVKTESSFSGAELTGLYLPYEEIGGDMFVVKEVEGKVWFMMADVTGHGISAAMISTMINAVFYSAVSQCKSSKDVLKRINNALIEVFNGSTTKLVSAFVGSIENRKLTISNAGHPYPAMIRREDRVASEVNLSGFLLGMLEDADFDQLEFTMNQGDVLVLYTDGLFDKGGKNNYLAWSKVLEYCQNNVEDIFDNEKKFVKNLVEYFTNLDGTQFVDDVAVMAIRIN